MADPRQIPGLELRPSKVDAQQMRPPRPRSVEGEGASFKDVLADAVTEVQRLQTEADTTVKQLVAGEIKDVTEAMVAVEKADVAFQTMMTVRNKVMAAYQEVMRMQM